jgi:glycine/D-amino acid oxidase-like deaminating enzyme
MHPAKAILARTDTRDELSSVRIANMKSSTETDIPCTNIIIAAGAWSPSVFTTLFPKSTHRLPISSLAGHSILVRSPDWDGERDDHGCHTVFPSREPTYSPELFSRVGGHIYVAGLNSANEPLPELATQARNNISRDAIDTLLKTANKAIATSGDGGLEVLREGLCFRPVTDRGTPILSRVPDTWLGPDVKTRSGADGGVYLATGHGPWGISMSLGTGKVMAEMIQGRPLSASIASLALEMA